MAQRTDSCEIAVRVSTRASADEIVGERGDKLLVRVSAPPVDGRANAAVCRMIAKRVGVGVRSVTIVRGASSRDKLVRVDGLSADDLRRALAPG